MVADVQKTDNVVHPGGLLTDHLICREFSLGTFFSYKRLQYFFNVIDMALAHQRIA